MDHRRPDPAEEHPATARRDTAAQPVLGQLTALVADSETPLASRSAPAVTPPIRVLMVEDNPGDARLILEMLREVSADDFTLERVNRLEPALKRLGKTGVDVVLLDLGLPDSTGLETFERAHRATTTEPIVVMSGMGNEQLALEAVRGGAQDYLVKGRIEGQSLARVIRYAVERKRVEVALREREVRFRQLAENIKEVFFVMDAQFRETLYINPAYEEAWGRSCHSLYERPASFLDSLFPEDHARGVAYMAQVQQGRDPGEIEFRVTRPDGTVRSMLAHAVPIRNDAGEVYRIAGVSLDITERKQAEEALRSSERRLRTLFETVNLIVLALDVQGRVEYVNPFFLQLTGYTRDEAFGSDWVQRFIPQSQRPKVSGVFHDLLERNIPPHYQNAILTKAGEERMISWHNTGLRDEQGRPTGTLSIGENITEHARLEQQFRQAQKMEAVGRLAGGIAHDFNNLLTVISSYSELLLEDLPAGDDTRRDDLGQIKKAAGDAAALTRQLLAFSRQQVLEPRIADLNEIVTGAGKMLQRVIGEDISLALVLAPDLGWVKADPGQIEQVIMNLAVNARDAMPQGGRLTIETANAELGASYALDHSAVTPGQYVQLVVSDTGVGMTEEIKRRLFEPFYTTKEVGKGTGLGLATVYGIVKQSDGFLWVYSEPGQGATFKIYLPRLNEAEVGEQRADAARPPARGTETVLLAEDAAPVRNVARQILERYGYTVLEAPNGRAALDILAQRRGPIHLLLTDVVMPEMSGRQLADRLMAQRPEIKALYISGYTDDSVVRHGVLEAGIAYLQKPFTPEALARKVREVLDGPAPVR